MKSTVNFPRDWRDHLARAINERDLSRIENLIETGYHEHGRTQFNDPLIADAAFLVKLAHDKAANEIALSVHHQQQQQQLQKHSSPSARSTRARLTNEKAGTASWVAPPIASLTQYGHTGRDHVNASLRERVSELREMALFPDSNSAVRRGGGGGGRSVSNMSSSSFSQLQHQQQQQERSHSRNHYQWTQDQMSQLNNNNNNNNLSSRSVSASVFGAGGSGVGGREMDEAATAMGVPSLWVSPPNEFEALKKQQQLLLEQQQQQQQQMSSASSSPQNQSRSASTRSFYYHTSAFEDPAVTGAALRLHSFVHKDEEPPVKSSRVFQAYVNADRNMPDLVSFEAERNISHAPLRANPADVILNESVPVIGTSNLTNAEIFNISPSRHPLHAKEVSESLKRKRKEKLEEEEQRQKQQEGGSSSRSVVILEGSVSPVSTVSDSSNSASAGRRRLLVGEQEQEGKNHLLHQHQQHSPEHHRLIRKLRAEASAPEAIEVTRMLRYLSASEALYRGTLEQSELSSRTNLAAVTQHGVGRSRGISTYAETKAPTVFMDN